MKKESKLVIDFLHRTGEIYNYVSENIQRLDHYFKAVPIEEEIIRKEIKESIVLYEKSTKIIDFDYLKNI